MQEWYKGCAHFVAYTPHELLFECKMLSQITLINMLNDIRLFIDAAYDLLTSRSKILALNSNNALLQFLLEVCVS